MSQVNETIFSKLPVKCSKNIFIYCECIIKYEIFTARKDANRYTISF